MADKKETKKTSVKSKKSNLQYVPNLRKLYDEEIISNLKKTFNYSNIMEFPSVKRVGINGGFNIGPVSGELFLSNLKDIVFFLLA